MTMEPMMVAVLVMVVASTLAVSSGGFGVRVCDGFRRALSLMSMVIVRDGGSVAAVARWLVLNALDVRR